MGVVIDTSVLIAAERKKLLWDELMESWGNESLFMASITLSELWHGCHRATGSVLRNRLNFVKQVEAVLPVLGFAVKEALVHAEISARLAEKGQPIGAHDLIIAATALAHNHSVATLNESEFQKIPHLWLDDVRQFMS